MPKYLHSLGRGALWSLLAALVATALWALFTATLAPLVSGEGPRTLARLWTTRVRLAIDFGGFVALMAIIPHALLLSLWLRFRNRFATSEHTPLRVAITSLILALPFTVIVFGSYAAPSYGLGPFWEKAFATLPWVLLSTWGGILLPRFVVRALRPTEQSVAA